MIEYRTQTILAILQSLLILAGSLIGPAMSGASGVSDDVLPLSIVLVKNWGFLFVVIPLIWALGTIRLEARSDHWFTRRWTIVSGVLLLVGLFYFFGRMALGSWFHGQLAS